MVMETLLLSHMTIILSLVVYDILLPKVTVIRELVQDTRMIGVMMNGTMIFSKLSYFTEMGHLPLDMNLSFLPALYRFFV